MVTRDEFKLLISGTQKDFEPVAEGKGNIPDHEISKLKEGDLILRNVNVSGSPFYHAGIYCGNEEVISFTAPSGTKWYEQIPRLLMPQQSASVIKESVTNFLNGKSFEVSRLKSDIPGDFSNSVKSGMKYNEEYNPCTNNSLHFALRLLKLPAEPLPGRNSTSDSENTRASGSQIWNDDVKKPPVKNDEEGQSLLKPKISESPTNEGDKMAVKLTLKDDDVKKPPVKKINLC